MEAVRQDLLQCKQKIQQLLIKDYSKHLPITKTTHLKHEVLQLPELVERGEFDHDKEKDEIFSNIRHMRQEITTLKNKLKSFDKTQSYLDEVQHISTTIEDNAASFKDKMMNLFEAIAHEEDQLTHDLELMDGKIEAYETTQPLVVGRPPLPAKQDDLKENLNVNNNNSQLDEIRVRIERVDERIKLNGGKTCSWEQDEHNDFLRIKTKHQGRVAQPQFLQDCVKNIALHTEPEIQEHIERYVKLCELEDLKKNLVVTYKQLKQQSKSDMLNQAAVEDKVKLQQLNLNKKSKEQVDLEREAQKQEIQKWRTNKTTHNLVELDMKVEERVELERGAHEKRQVEREQTKLIVHQYREQKQLQSLREKESDQYQQMMRRNISQDAKQRIRAREEDMIEKRMSKLESERIKQVEKEWNLQKMQEDKLIKYAYVDNKLLQTTKATKSHQRGKFDATADNGKYADTFGGNILGSGGRAVPSWRQGA